MGMSIGIKLTAEVIRFHEEAETKPLNEITFQWLLGIE